jgi:hypothetical protein
VYKLLKLLIPFMITSQVAVVATSSRPLVLDGPKAVDNFAFVENQLLASSRYTQPDTYPQAIEEAFTSTYQLFYTPNQLRDLGFVQVLDNATFNLYIEKDSFSLVLENKLTGTMFSSRPEFQGYSGSREDNVANRNLMNSGLWIESLRATNVSNSAIRVESLYTLANVDYENNGSQNLDNINPLRPYELKAGSYNTNAVSVNLIEQEHSHVTYQIQLSSYGFVFDVSIGLSSNGFFVDFDPSTIQENDTRFRLTGLQFFPYFGSARENAFPGYMVIPDGNGALIRTNKQYDTSFQADYYGSDRGYGRTSIAQLTMPVFGFIHRVNDQGFWTEIESGAEHSTMLAQFWGRGTRYHRLTNRFNLRRVYRNIINRAGDGSDVIPPEHVLTPFRAHYRVLEGNQANYVGMANAYQAQLVNRGILQAQSYISMPIHLNWLLTEQEPAFFGTSQITMTTPSHVNTYSRQLFEQGVKQQTIGLAGWSTDGYTYYAPYRTQFANRSSLANTIDSLQERGFETYLEQGYITSTSRSRRVDFNRDVARNYSKLKMSRASSRFDSDNLNFYHLYPEQAYAMMRNDVRTFESLGVDGLLMRDFGNVLTSYYDGQRRNRTHTMGILEDMAQLMGSFALSTPHAYMLAHAKHYMDVPITNAQLDLYTDLVPFVTYTLRGYMAMYTPYLNFNALGKERLLQMIDFGVFPSYLLTHAASTNLRYTYSNRYFTTAFSDFENDIVDVYAYVSAIYKDVAEGKIVSRTILTPGVTQIQYDHGVILYVNYRSQPYTVNGVTIRARDVEVVRP